MYFEVIGEITDVERIAVGSSIRDCGSSMVLDAGESSKVLPQSASEVVGYGRSSYIGMRLTV
jgi:hypothetical protein